MLGKNAGDAEMTVEEFLKGKVSFWKFSKLLMQIYQKEEPLSQRLIRKLTEYNGDEGKERIARKVRNWMHDRNLPQNREELFKICFALELDEKSADMVLGIAAESGIHYRNARELVYAYSLRKGMDYPEAAECAKRLGVDMLNGFSGRAEVRNLCAEFPAEALTGHIRSRFDRIKSEKDLQNFFEVHREKFGIQHRTAYRKFRKMLESLLCPSQGEGLLPNEQDYSIKKVVEQYLRMGVPYDRRSGGYTQLQRTLKQHWPSAKSICEMCSGKADVDRKTLLLLYLATEGEGGTEISEPGSVMEHQRRMDLMLAQCGMPALNIHCPFDYLILLAVRKEEEDDFISGRMEKMLRKIFNTERPAAYLVTGE